MRLEQEEMTPKRARDLLEASLGQKQRALANGRVERIAHSIVEGQWKVTHQGIALSPEGYILDGQHRLAAIVRANIPVTMMVAYDADPDTFDVIDTGAARTAANTLQVAGYVGANGLSACSRMLLTYDRIKTSRTPPKSATAKLTTADVIRLMNTDRGQLILDSQSDAGSLATAWGRYGSRSWVMAGQVLLREAGHSKEQLDTFNARLRDGAFLEPGSPILAFRRFVMSDTGLARLAKDSKSYVALAVFIKTFNAYVSGQERLLAVFKLGVEPYPIPYTPEQVEKMRIEAQKLAHKHNLSKEQALAAAEKAEQAQMATSAAV
jgi:hypothetical protein